MHKYRLVLLSPGTGVGESFSSRHNNAVSAVWQAREQEAGAGGRGRNGGYAHVTKIPVLQQLCDHLPRKIQLMRIVRRLHYWWSLFVAGALLLICGPPILTVAWLTGKHYLVYSWANFGARNWLRLSGVKVHVKGKHHLDPQQTYVFVANHRSYLDTVKLFLHTGRRIVLLAKKELLKVPILGVGMGFVNIMAIDRSNRERALQTTEAATARIR